MKAIDPVCRMEVDTETAEYTLEYEGTTYYFCTPLCMVQFESNPEKFVRRAEQGRRQGDSHTR